MDRRCDRAPIGGGRSGAPQYALQGLRSRLHPEQEPRQGPVHRHGLPRHRLPGPPPGRGPAAPRAPRGVARRRTAGCRDLRRVSRARRAGDRGRGPEAPRSRVTGRPLRSPLHLRYHGQAEGCHDDARAEPPCLRGLERDRRPAQRGPLPDREPLLPRLRLQGRLALLRHAWRHDPAAAELRCADHPRPHRPRTRECDPGAADRLPVHPLPPEAERGRPVLPAARGHRCGTHPGRADSPDARRPGLRDGHHGLRPDGDLRHRDHVPRRRPPRRSSRTARAGRSTASKSAASIPTARMSRAASPAR